MCIHLSFSALTRSFPSVRRKRWRLQRTCAGVCSLWWLWSKEAASASAAWRLSWRHFWRASSHSIHLVSHPQSLHQQHDQPSVANSFNLFLLLSSTETGLEQRHMAFCGLFSDTLALLNGVGVSTGEALAAHVITWLDRKGRGFPILPLLTACSRCLASVRHMTRIMEACITAYFNHGNQSLQSGCFLAHILFNWGFCFFLSLESCQLVLFIPYCHSIFHFRIDSLISRTHFFSPAVCLCFHFSWRGVCRLGSCVGVSAGAWTHSGWLPLWEPIRRQLPDTLRLHPAAPQHWIHSSQWEEDSGSNQHMDHSGLPQVWPPCCLYKSV